MGLDNFTRSIYGWKIEGCENVKRFEKEIEKINENYYDDYNNFLVIDYMCSSYIYFGADLVKYNAYEDNEVTVNQQLITKATNDYNNFLKEHPELDKYLQKQIGKTTTNIVPQLFIFQQIW